jgi:hypothetical protein
MLCRNKQCQKGNGKRAKLPKTAFPPVCDDECRDAVIAAAVAQSRASAARAIKKAQNTKALEEKARRRQSRKKRRDFMDNDVTRQKSLTQIACNKLCLLLDRGKPCISCGRPDDGQPRKRNASHFKSRGASSALRFDLLNLHAACVVCNLYQSGNIVGYRDGLASRYGEDMVGYLESAPRLKEWTPEELRQLRQEFRDEIKRIEQGLAPLKDWRALPESGHVSKPMERVA